jgi:hypothetical protein
MVVRLLFFATLEELQLFFFVIFFDKSTVEASLLLPISVFLRAFERSSGIQVAFLHSAPPLSPGAHTTRVAN